LSKVSMLIVVNSILFHLSRETIVVLTSVSDFVKGKSLPSIFTFKRDVVLSWLRDAKVPSDMIIFISFIMCYNSWDVVHLYISPRKSIMEVQCFESLMLRPIGLNLINCTLGGRIM
jgi:hypothetical protein